jgi:hypothetical protein
VAKPQVTESFALPHDEPRRPLGECAWCDLLTLVDGIEEAGKLIDAAVLVRQQVPDGIAKNPSAKGYHAVKEFDDLYKEWSHAGS